MWQNVQWGQDDGEWDISDNDDDDLRSDSWKEYDKVKTNIKEIKFFQLSFLFCFVHFWSVHSVMVSYTLIAEEGEHPT